MRFSVALKQNVSASTQNQALQAVLFFYRTVLEKPIANVNALRATRPVHERYSPTVHETRAILQIINNQGGYLTNLVARLLYGCGLRVSEPLNLRIKDVDLARGKLCIQQLSNYPLTFLLHVFNQKVLSRVCYPHEASKKKSFSPQFQIKSA